MLIKEIGGETALIEKIKKIMPSTNRQDLLVGIGDDAAVIKMKKNENEYLLVTTDTLVSGDHFNTSWSTPTQIGIKSAECNISDIAAMGGDPTFMFVSLVLTKQTTVDWVCDFYKGLSKSCNKYNINIVGGDTTHGTKETINITLLGYASKQNLCLRSDAKDGDVFALTGDIGQSAAALNLLKRDFKVSSFLLKKHLTPNCRLDVSRKIAPFVNAMIDISDGLASEINHICNQSKIGAIIYEKDIPLHSDVISAGEKLGISPSCFALNGGEDFELLFSIDPNKLKKLDQLGINYFIVGKIVSKENGCILIKKNASKVCLKGGYDHFK